MNILNWPPFELISVKSAFDGHAGCGGADDDFIKVADPGDAADDDLKEMVGCHFNPPPSLNWSFNEQILRQQSIHCLSLGQWDKRSSRKCKIFGCCLLSMVNLGFPEKSYKNAQKR